MTTKKTNLAHRSVNPTHANPWILNPIAFTVLGLFASIGFAQEAQLEPIVVIEQATPDYKTEQVTIGGKTPQKIREIPNSVSVLKRKQMDDQNMVTTWDALSQITGVQAISNDGTQGQFFGRGAALDLQHDGVPSTLPLSGYQQNDLAMYDRLEVLRGPAGLTQGSGSYAGAVNLVRKRPKSAFAANFLASTGSWNNNRLEADVTGALNKNKTIRGRVAASFIDRDFFYNRAHEKKWLVYGTVDFDLTPNTLANLYLSYQKDRSPGFSGLPAYTNGVNLDVPRSFNPYPEWNRDRWSTRDLGGEVTHQFDSGWKITLKGNNRKQTFFFHDAYAQNGVDPATNTIANYYRREFDYKYSQNSVDVFANGEFKLLGRKHELLLGANYSNYKNEGVGANPNSPNSAYLKYPNVLLSDPPNVPDVAVTYTTGSASKTEQYGLYGKLNLSLTDRLKLILGGRLSGYDYQSRTTAPNPTPTDWKQGAKAGDVFTPYAGILFDLNKASTLYASYADVFVPQTAQRVDGSILDPRVGKQYEVGTKIDWLGGKLATNLAAFYIADTNRSVADPANTGFYLQSGKWVSKGWEFEVTGSPLPSWNISAGYSDLITTKVTDTPATQGLPISYWYPRSMYKLWTQYHLGNTGNGYLDKITLGLGINGATHSASGASTATEAARVQGHYTVVKMQVGYEISKNFALTLDVNNVFDTKYYTRLGGTNTYNFYGDPRNFTLTLRGKY